MGLFAWNDGYVLGLAMVDNEHQALFAIADQLNEAISRGEGTWAVKNLATRLVGAITTNFEHEEALMRHYRYPDFEDHIDEHRVMAERMLKVKKLLDAGALTIPPDTLPFLRNWIDRHIRRFDQPMVRHIRANAMAVLES